MTTPNEELQARPDDLLGTLERIGNELRSRCSSGGVDCEICKVQKAALDYAIAALARQEEGREAVGHDSDCAQHNAPATPAGPCDCSIAPIAWIPRDHLDTLRQYRADGYQAWVEVTNDGKAAVDPIALYTHPTPPIAALAPHSAGEGDAALVDRAVTRFLSWRLPDDFAPDSGISFKPITNTEWTHDCWPTGTNLLHAGQAKALFEHCLATPTPQSGEAGVERGLPTDRRMKAVELLLSQGYRWSEGEWIAPATPQAAGVDSRRCQECCGSPCECPSGMNTSPASLDCLSVSATTAQHLRQWLDAIDSGNASVVNDPADIPALREVVAALATPTPQSGEADNFGHAPGCTSAHAGHPYSTFHSCCLGAAPASPQGVSDAQEIAADLRADAVALRHHGASASPKLLDSYADRVAALDAAGAAPEGWQAALVNEWESAAKDLRKDGLYRCCAGTYEHCAAHLKAGAQHGQEVMRDDAAFHGRIGRLSLPTDEGAAHD